MTLPQAAFAAVADANPGLSSDPAGLRERSRGAHGAATVAPPPFLSTLASPNAPPQAPSSAMPMAPPMAPPRG